ncbi:hypothetical protein DSOUD_1198 [Desulfuromonas soudanensis]|uniref:Uncharacterized protein n=1 Tax=Desulfuromonas soudanensis TaxID=1603606 RepID=A0A0M3QFC6_9BACT|nr:hypothetical protein [Desulfuromonas soudanensis]ALC15979.1 hypothetical protein DSOUD_1198 [Desulfuromonas soudanensis]
MFVLHKEIQRLEVPAERVLLLQRSLTNIQVAIPGTTSQETTAYLCVFAAGKGYRIVAVLHQLSSRRLLFYLNNEGEVQQREANRILKEGIHFVESMGFILSDLDFQRLSPRERTAVWQSLPLKTGIVAAAPAAEPAAAKGVQASPPVSPPPPPSAPPTGETLAQKEQIPPAAEQRARQKAFLENIGRFLSSL